IERRQQTPAIAIGIRVAEPQPREKLRVPIPALVPIQGKHGAAVVFGSAVGPEMHQRPGAVQAGAVGVLLAANPERTRRLPIVSPGTALRPKGCYERRTNGIGRLEIQWQKQPPETVLIRDAGPRKGEEPRTVTFARPAIKGQDHAAPITAAPVRPQANQRQRSEEVKTAEAILAEEPKREHGFPLRRIGTALRPKGSDERRVVFVGSLIIQRRQTTPEISILLLPGQPERGIELRRVVVAPVPIQREDHAAIGVVFPVGPKVHERPGAPEIGALVFFPAEDPEREQGIRAALASPR